MKTQACTVPFPTTKPALRRGGYQAIIWLDKAKNYRVYLDLNAGEAKWLRAVATAFSLTIEEFIKQFYRRQLPGPPYDREQNEQDYTEKELELFTVSCNDAKVWGQVKAIALHDKLESPERFCLDAILSSLECSNETFLFDPRTSAVICELDAIYALAFQTNLESEPPLQRGGRPIRGIAMKPLKRAPVSAVRLIRGDVSALTHPG